MSLFTRTRALLSRRYEVGPVPPPPVESINIDVAFNAVSGVAPFAFFVDATGTTADATTRPYHDLEYRHNFGDSGAGTWAEGVYSGVKLKNVAKGPVACHVYETPGTYTYAIRVTDGASTGLVQTTVTVNNPDVVFAANTTCISATSDFTGAPGGATLVTDSDFDAAISSAISGGARRILFHRGQTFNASSGVNISTPGDMIIGAFGSGDKPIISIGANGITAISPIGGATGVRIMDLTITGNYRASGEKTWQVGGGALNSTILRVSSLVSGGCNITSPRLQGLNTLSAETTYTAVHDCDWVGILGGNGNMPIYSESVFKYSVQGCFFDNSDGGEYNLRYQGGTHGVISHNTMVRCGVGKSMFTARGGFTTLGNPVAEYISGKHVISDNLFDSATCTNVSTPVSIVPQNSTRNERIEDIIFERNITTASANQTPALVINARKITARNNIFEATTTASISPVISIYWAFNTAGLPAPEDIHILNNSAFSNTPLGGGVSLVSILNQGILPINTVVKNNAVYAPNVAKDGAGNGGPTVVVNQGTGTVIEGNTPLVAWNVNNWVKTPPAIPFSTIPPLAADPTDWAIVAGSYAEDTGVSVPVWSDFNEVELTSASVRNMGAIGG